MLSDIWVKEGYSCDLHFYNVLLKIVFFLLSYAFFRLKAITSLEKHIYLFLFRLISLALLRFKSPWNRPSSPLRETLILLRPFLNPHPRVHLSSTPPRPPPFSPPLPRPRPALFLRDPSRVSWDQGVEPAPHRERGVEITPPPLTGGDRVGGYVFLR